jgi:hypothetical protein
MRSEGETVMKYMLLVLYIHMYIAILMQFLCNVMDTFEWIQNYFLWEPFGWMHRWSRILRNVIFFYIFPQSFVVQPSCTLRNVIFICIFPQSFLVQPSHILRNVNMLLVLYIHMYIAILMQFLCNVMDTFVPRFLIT